MRKFSFFNLPEIVFASLVILSGFLLGFSSGGFIVNFKTLGFSAFSSLQKGVNVVFDKTGSVFTAARDMANLQKEYDALVEKVQNYEFLQRNNVEIKKENERLRELLGFSLNFDYRNVSAQIIGRETDNFYSGITIDKGARSGIKKGMPVVAIQHGIAGVVGKVVTVGHDTCIVMPVYDSRCNISARIQSTRDLGLVSGAGSSDLPLNLQYIKKRVYSDIHIGDIIVTSGENGNFMRDIPIGAVSKVNILEYDTSLDIELLPILDFSRLETVFIIDQKVRNENKIIDGD